MDAGATTISYFRADGCRFTRLHEEFSEFVNWEGCPMALGFRRGYAKANFKGG